MPAKPEAQAIARAVCRKCRTETAALFVNKRDYLYARCPKCFADQANGAAAQEYFWTHARLLPGIDAAAIARPPNLPEYLGAIGEPAPEPPEPAPLATSPVPESAPAPPAASDDPGKPAPAAVKAEPDPASEPASDQEEKPETAPKKKGGIVAFLMIAAGIAGAVVTGTVMGGGQ